MRKTLRSVGTFSFVSCIDDQYRIAVLTVRIRVRPGRYFGEKPKDSDKQSYCNRFCDVCKNPQEVIAATQALQSEMVVASQMPQIRSEADEEWNDQEEQDSRIPISRSTSLADSDGLPPTVQGLPGFAKASDLHLQKKRSVVEIDDDSENEDEKDVSTLENQLFPEEVEDDNERAAYRAELPREHVLPTMTIDEPVQGEIWVPRKRLNRDLSRHNSASTSHTSLAPVAAEDVPQVLDCTPRVTAADVHNVDTEDFWAQTEEAALVAVVQKQLASRSATVALSPPRAPIPKYTGTIAPPQQASSSRCELVLFRDC